MNKNARSDLVKAQSLLHEAADDLAGALVLFGRFDPDSRRDHFEYLRDFTKELECAVKALGGRIEWQTDAEIDEAIEQERAA